MLFHATKVDFSSQTARGSSRRAQLQRPTGLSSCEPRRGFV